MPPGRRGTDTERGGIPMSPGVIFDSNGNPVGYGDEFFPGAPTPGGATPSAPAFAPPTGPPATGPNVPPAPGSTRTPRGPQSPRVPKNTSAPRTPKAQEGRGGALSRILRGAASKLRGNKKK
jgi:hypothetical protein